MMSLSRYTVFLTRVTTIAYNDKLRSARKYPFSQIHSHYRRNLSVAWIDYKKAYDMVPHKWLHTALKSIRAPKQVRRTVRRLATKWETSITLKTVCGSKTEKIKLQRGLFQETPSHHYCSASVLPLYHGS